MQVYYIFDNNLATIMYNFATIMQGCTTYIQSWQDCVHLARDDCKVVCTLQRLMQGCHKLAATLQGCLAARLPQPRNFHMGIYSREKLLFPYGIFLPCYNLVDSYKVMHEVKNAMELCCYKHCYKVVSNL